MENNNVTNVEETNVSAPVQETPAQETPATSTLAQGVMHDRNIKTVAQKQLVGKIFVYIALYAFLGFMALVVLFPFYWMLISSVKTVKEYELSTPTLFPQQIMGKMGIWF